MSASQQQFLYGSNATYIAELQQQWRQDAASVAPDWARWFEQLDGMSSGLGKGGGNGKDMDAPPSWGRAQGRVIGADGGGDVPPPTATLDGALNGAGDVVGDSGAIRAATLDSIKAIMLIRAYRIRGHLQASLDPLDLVEKTYHPELDPETYGFTDADLDRPIFINHVLGLEIATLRQILEVVRETYCGSIGVEFMHIQDPDENFGFKNALKAFATIPNSPI